jgi:hypothetical protein
VAKLNGPLAPGTEVEGFLLSPDGSTAVYRTRQYVGNEIYAVPVTGGSARKLHGSFLFPSIGATVRISSTGPTVVYAASQAPAYVNELYGVALFTDVDADAIPDSCDACTDTDGDGAADPGFPGSTCAQDNCPDVSNPAQSDGDGDGVGDVCDPCPAQAERAQQDDDGDGDGNACDPCPLDPSNDIDGDGFCSEVDNCPLETNRDQSDADADEIGDACDDCPEQFDPLQGASTKLNGLLHSKDGDLPRRPGSRGHPGAVQRSVLRRHAAEAERPHGNIPRRDEVRHRA